MGKLARTKSPRRQGSEAAKPQKITSRELIASALAAQKVRRHTKVRLSQVLYERATQCAREVDESVSRWLELCTRPGHLARAQAAGVKVPAEWLVASRESVVATVDGSHPDHGLLRLCVAAGVLWCEARSLPAFACELREGVDYYLEREE